MANPYRALFAQPGARSFVPASFVGRMAMSMLGIGIVLMVTGTHGGYALAGAVAATTQVAYAVTSPLVARLVDRVGQRRVLVPLVSANAVAMTALILCAQLGAPSWSLFPTGILVGMTSPSMGALVRARWSYLLSPTGGKDKPPLQTAFAMESVLDELVFITGPTLATLLATAVIPAGGLAAAGLFTFAGGLAFAAQYRTEPPARGLRRGGRNALAYAGMPGMALVFLALGVVFGAVEVSAIAFSEEQGHKGLSGVVLACFAAGSGLAGLWYGAREWVWPLGRRFRLGLVVFAAGLVPVALVESLPLMMVVIFFAGLAISPTIIPAYGVLERIVPEGQLTEGLTWASTAVGLGVAGGASAAGAIIDARGSGPAFAFALGVGVLGALLGLVAVSRLHNDAKREFSS
ncbi:MFS transporter [Actinocorallia sp. A-T 12471]|uniref:MFS transporter n=1 Tax=Actinocorallia sp. A-T 12471 TaxID=3089813 RepID=UPI0029D0481A|nr:MFS transporter [Actinocorallia sp. A-T 12471]MDX6739765.1 MFS transporter [Actinocorallia sp. A-T 12471]